MIHPLKKKSDFKVKLIEAWKNNSTTWISTKPYNVIMIFIRNIINKKQVINTEKKVILDVGCGDGWFLELSRQVFENFEYTGIDTNQEFISYNSKIFLNHTNAKFFNIDMESDLFVNEFTNKINLVFSSMSLIEITELPTVFTAFSQILMKGGDLYIVTLNPINQLIRTSKNIEDDLQNYFSENSIYYFIDSIHTIKSSHDYNVMGILYPTDQYIKYAEDNNLRLITFHEFAEKSLDNSIPPLFQFFHFKKENI